MASAPKNTKNTTAPSEYASLDIWSLDCKINPGDKIKVLLSGCHLRPRGKLTKLREKNESLITDTKNAELMGHREILVVGLKL